MKTWTRVLPVAVISLSLIGCQQSSHQEDPQTVLDKAWTKLVEKNVEYESGTIDFDGSGSIDMEGNEASLDGKITVKFDSSDPEASKSALNLDLNGEGSFEEMAGKVSLTGELRQFPDSLYVYLKNLEVESDDQQTTMMANLMGNLYKDQWIAIPSNGASALQNVTVDIAKQREVAEVAKKHNFFEVEEDLGNNRYSIRMNPEKMKAYLTEVAKVSADAEVMEEDLQAIDELFQTADYTLKVQIGSDYDLEWVSGDFTIANPNEAESLTLTFEGTIGDNSSEGSINLSLNGESPGSLKLDFTANHDFSSVDIDVPEDAQELDLGAMMGGMGAGMPSDGMGAIEEMEGMEGMEDLEDLPIPTP